MESDNSLHNYGKFLIKPSIFFHSILILLSIVLLSLSYNSIDMKPDKTLWFVLLISAIMSTNYIGFVLYYLYVKQINHFWHQRARIKGYLILMSIYLIFNIIMCTTILFIQNTINTVPNIYLFILEISWIIFYVISSFLICLISFQEKNNDINTLPLPLCQYDNRTPSPLSTSTSLSFSLDENIPLGDL